MDKQFYTVEVLLKEGANISFGNDILYQDALSGVYVVEPIDGDIEQFPELEKAVDFLMCR